MRFRIYKTTDADLRCALDRKQFVPFYQPIYDITQGRVLAVEMLARRAHPTLGILPPALFLKRVIESGYTEQMLRSLCAQLPALPPGNLPVDFNINLAFQELCGKNVFAWLRGTMQRLKQAIALEIPSILFSQKLVGELFPALHGQMIDDKPIQATAPVVQYTMPMLQQYAAEGFKIIIDGAQHSLAENMACNELPIHSLKYTIMSQHQSFDPNLIARSVATGIENIELLQKALRMGFTALQGNFIAHPCGDFAQSIDHSSIYIAQLLCKAESAIADSTPLDEKKFTQDEKSA